MPRSADRGVGAAAEGQELLGGRHGGGRGGAGVHHPGGGLRDARLEHPLRGAGGALVLRPSEETKRWKKAKRGRERSLELKLNGPE